MVETGNGTVKQTAIAVRPFFDNQSLIWDWKIMAYLYMTE
jgi:hypothetical protein